VHPLRDPTLDVVFQLLFTRHDEAHEALIGLLTAVLRPTHPMASVEIFDPAVGLDDVDDKSIGLDVRVRFRDGTMLNEASVSVFNRSEAQDVLPTLSACPEVRSLAIASAVSSLDPRRRQRHPRPPPPGRQTRGIHAQRPSGAAATQRNRLGPMFSWPPHVQSPGAPGPHCNDCECVSLQCSPRLQSPSLTQSLRRQQFSSHSWTSSPQRSCSLDCSMVHVVGGEPSLQSTAKQGRGAVPSAGHASQKRSSSTGFLRADLPENSWPSERRRTQK
jgi:hypothetical protein